MVRYRRNFVPGGTYFFTVTLVDRTSPALVDKMTALRTAVRIARQERPFTRNDQHGQEARSEVLS
jgi:putative transposase